jgi:putative ABC transport system substrate-binding protein
MRRRRFLSVLGGVVVVWPLAAFAQNPAKVVGLLSVGPPIADNSRQGTPLVRRLAEHGYVLGRNLAFERRGAEGRIDHLPQLVTELVASKVDVIVAFGYLPALAAKEGSTLPAVAINAGDPVSTGLVESLARPRGNLTGISDVSVEVTPKRLELLKEIAPKLQRVAVLWNANDPGMTSRYRALEAGAKVLGVSVEPLGVREPDDFDQAFETMNRDMPDAILMVSDSLTTLNRKRVFEFATLHRLPAIYEYDYLVRDGGLMSYGPEDEESFMLAADLVVRILKGAKPTELPFEQPTLFRFVLNLKTAKSIGLTIPPSILARADEVIE